MPTFFKVKSTSATEEYNKQSYGFYYNSKIPWGLLKWATQQDGLCMWRYTGKIRDLSGSERAHVAATGRGIAATLEDGGSAPRSHGAARGEVSYAGSIAASGAGRPRRTAARPAPRPPSKDEEGSGSMRPRCNGNSLTRSERRKPEEWSEEEE
ncbi:uncharacterized protein [Periplaneta americana]|uniref:uncharacterized protein isoform X2 n=1 Tax=Periplaneta americana TaxID=6978 RepID=UPI0037E8F1BD